VEPRPRFLDAVAVASDLHAGQRRRGTDIPYIAHLLVVTGLVIEDGGGEDEAIAALLHDAIEDAGGAATRDAIAERFGARVAAIVEACSDTLDPDPEEPWLQRKQRYLEHLPQITDEGVLRVALADKVHNARSIVRDYRREGHGLWERFGRRTARDQLWYYGRLLAFFEQRCPGPLTEDLRHSVGELCWLVLHDRAHWRRRGPGRLRSRLAALALALYARLADHPSDHALRAEAGPEAVPARARAT